MKNFRFALKFPISVPDWFYRKLQTLELDPDDSMLILSCSRQYLDLDCRSSMYSFDIQSNRLHRVKIKMSDNSNMTDVPTKFADLPSPHLKCPICGGLYKDPVINIKCGHTFCRSCAFTTTRCPVDNSHCDTSQVVVNR